MDEIVVVWPGGVTRTLTGYKANSTWTLYPDELLADSDDDGDVDPTDFAQFSLCFAGSSSVIQPGCERMALDGDGDVDFTDFAGFSLRFTGVQ